MQIKSLILDKWYEPVGGTGNSILLKSSDKYVLLSLCDMEIQMEYYNAGYNGKGDLLPVYLKEGVDDIYGFINKDGKEVIPFIYDYVWNFEDNGYAQVKRFGQIYVVDTLGNLYSGFPKDNKETKKLTKDQSVIQGFDFKSTFYPIKKNNTWLVISKWNVKENGEYSEQTKIYQCEKIVFLEEDIHLSNYLIIRNGDICTLIIDGEIKKSYKADSVEPIIELDEYGEDIINRLIIRKDRKYGVCLINSDLLLPTDYDSIIPVISSVLFDPYYDNINDYSSWISGFIVEKNRKYGIINKDGDVVLPSDYDFIDKKKIVRNNCTGEYVIIIKDKKCSLVNVLSGNYVFPLSYDEIIINDLTSLDSTFVIKNDGKYGFATFDGIMLDVKYDKIEFDWSVDCDGGYYYFFKLYKEGKVGIYEYSCIKKDRIYPSCFDFFVKSAYDECVFLKNEHSKAASRGMSYVAVMQNKKWGILDVQVKYTYCIQTGPETIWTGEPNLDDLKFKYNSLEELKQDADAEFEKRKKRQYN